MKTLHIAISDENHEWLVKIKKQFKLPNMLEVFEKVAELAKKQLEEET